MTIDSAMTVTCHAGLFVRGISGEESILNIYANDGSDVADRWRFIAYSQSDFTTGIELQTYQTSSWTDIWSVVDDSFYSLSIYNDTTATAANVYIDGSAKLFRSTSSAKYKGNIQDLINSDRIYSLRPVTFQERVMKKEKVIKDIDKNTAIIKLIGTDKLKPDTRIGLIAEEVAEVMPEMVDYDKDGQPDGVHYAMLVSPLIAEVKKLRARVEELEKNK